MRRIFVCLFVVLACAGCSIFPRWRNSGGGVAMPAVTNVHDVVAHLNRNITGTEQQGGLIGWRSLNVAIRQEGAMPFSAPGKLHVEAPRNFRLNVSMPITEGELLDVGSNNDEFWFWTKDQNPPYLLTAHHEDAEMALATFRLPLQPDWVMEVLGVIPLDPNEYELRPRPNSPLIELVSIRTAPGGERVQKTLIVDTRQGHIVQHTLHATTGRLIAAASLGDYWRDPATHLEVPRDIRLNFPEANLNISMRVSHPEVNPTLPATVWEVPTKNGYRRVDMGDHVRQMQRNVGAVGEIEQVGRSVVGQERLAPHPERDYQLASPGSAARQPAVRPFPDDPRNANHAADPRSHQPFDALDRVDQEQSSFPPLAPPGRATINSTNNFNH